jgi:PPM family protein phosphatase
MRVESWALTDVGRVRKHNEDGWLIDEALGLFAVADGMGGHAAGEVASAFALSCIQEELRKKKELLDAYAQRSTPERRVQVLRELESAINIASSGIFHLAQRDKKRHGMGTTLSTVLVVGSKAFMAHVGDSRVYLHRAGQVHQLSEDHSYLWEQIKKGVITVDEAKRSPFSNVITRAVGITESVEVDTLVLDLLPGDLLLACSDGLHGYLEGRGELADLIGTLEGDKALEKLVGLANERGGKDNITGLIIRVPGDADEPMALDARDRIDVLKNIPLFRHLQYKELVKVLNLTKHRAFAAGETIISEDEKGSDCFVILSGEVEVKKGERLLTVLRRGVHFGEMALIDHSPRSATVCAAKDSRLISLSRQAFYDLVRTEPVLGTKLLWSFVQVLSHRLRATNEALSDVRSDGNVFAPFAEIDRLQREAMGLATAEMRNNDRDPQAEQTTDDV